MKMWKTRSGRKIRIKDMDDSHLMNSIRMLERMHGHSVSELYSLSCFIQGEQASLDIDNAIAQAEDGGPSESYPIYDDLMEEAVKRGLVYT
jgi:hypothetical protein